MQPSTTKDLIEIVKNAIMVEIKGHQLYSHAADQVASSSARTMFTVLAQDEAEHIRMLQAQHRSLLEHGRFDASAIHPAEVDHGAGTVIDDDFRRSLARGKFEMAVIGIGCDLERNSIAYYQTQADTAADPEARKLFARLVEWEEGHLRLLLELEREAQDAYWADQGFAPM